MPTQVRVSRDTSSTSLSSSQPLEYFSVLIKARQQPVHAERERNASRLIGRDWMAGGKSKSKSKSKGNGVEEVYRVKLPGNPVVGEGKPENQNHALIFTRGEHLQAIDMNQEGSVLVSIVNCRICYSLLLPRDIVVGVGNYSFFLIAKKHNTHAHCFKIYMYCLEYIFFLYKCGGFFFFVLFFWGGGLLQYVRSVFFLFSFFFSQAPFFLSQKLGSVREQYVQSKAPGGVGGGEGAPGPRDYNTK